MYAKWILQSLIWLVAMGALLLVPAGTLHWLTAWVLLATMAVISISMGWWLAKTDPGLLAERMRVAGQRDQPVADKIFMLALGTFAPIWLIAMGFEHRRQSSEFPISLQVLGFVTVMCSTLFITRVMHEYSFAAPVVKVQRAAIASSLPGLMPGCDIPCTLAPSCFAPGSRCYWVRGGA